MFEDNKFCGFGDTYQNILVVDKGRKQVRLKYNLKAKRAVKNVLILYGHKLHNIAQQEGATV